MAALDRLPPTVPEINREAWTDLARAAGNRQPRSRAISTEGGTADTEAIRAEFGRFPRDADRSPTSEGHAENSAVARALAVRFGMPSTERRGQRLAFSWAAT